MSPLKLDLTKSAAIDAAINTAEGKATTRTADSSTATALANFAETELTNLGLPKKYWKGAKATYLPGAVCGSYGYAAFGTWLELTYGSEGWFLTGCDRRKVGSGHNGTYERQKLVLSLEQQRLVLRSNPALSDLLYELLKLKADVHYWRNFAFSNATEAAAPMKRNA